MDYRRGFLNSVVQEPLLLCVLFLVILEEGVVDLNQLAVGFVVGLEHSNLGILLGKSECCVVSTAKEAGEATIAVEGEKACGDSGEGKARTRPQAKQTSRNLCKPPLSL